jgi:hypothetical protein
MIEMRWAQHVAYKFKTNQGRIWPEKLKEIDSFVYQDIDKRKILRLLEKKCMKVWTGLNSGQNSVAI